MTTDRRLIGATLGLALFVAACGGSSAASSAASAAASTGASQAAAASQAASQAPASEAAASDSPAASMPEVSMPDISLAPGSASDLEAMLPSTVGTVTFQKTSIDGSQIAGAGTPIDSSKLDPLLSKYGKSLADVRIAIATGGSSGSGMPDVVYAFQLKGVPASEWATQLDAGAGGKTTTIGGKEVVGQTQGGLTSVFYAKDDVLFMVLASPKDAEGIVSQLP